METIVDIATGMRQSEFISAVNNNFTYLNMGASIQTIDASGTPAKISSNFSNLNAKTPFPATLDSVADGMLASDYINAIQGNFTKIKAAQTLKNVGAKLIIRFDDGFDTTYSEWYPLLESLGVNGVVAALAEHYSTNHSGMTTNETYFSFTKALAMQNNGWDIACHGKLYTDDYSNYTQAQVDNLLKDARDIFIANGINSVHYMAHGSNNANPVTPRLEIAARKYFKSASLNNALTIPENVDIFNMSVLSIDGAYSGQSAYNISTVDGLTNMHNLFLSMIGTNLTCMIAGHAPSTDLKNGMTTIINDAKSLGIEIVTMSEFYNGLIKV